MVNYNNALFARTRYDVATEVLHDQVTALIIDYAKRRAYGYDDLSEDTANRSNFEEAIWSHNPQVVVISSHGSEEGIMGQDQTTEIVSPANSLFLKGRLAYFIACNAGKGLAPICVSNGCKAVLAFNDTLTIAAYEQPDGKYIIVDAFQDTLTTPEILFDGVKVQDAYNKTIEKFNTWITHYDETDPMIADILRFDRDHFILEGNGNESVQMSWYLMMGMGDILLYIYCTLYTLTEAVKLAKEWRK
jgi:hypothetical protein